jgi:OFA family oxalate/formate antiporter-like MFS transporter
MAAGFGGGTALFIPVISSLIESRGYQATFIATGLFQGLVILIVAQFLRHPAAASAPVAKPAAAGASAIGTRHFTTAEMLRTPQFYAMYAAFVLMATGGLLVTAQAGPIARAWGYTAAVLTLAASLSPIANAASRIFWGWASDRIGREIAMVIAFVLQAICLFLVLVLGRLSPALFIVMLVLVYFTWGEIYSLFPSAVGDYFGTRHATSNYAVLYTAKGVASIIGGWFSAYLFEQVGSWALAFYGSALMALIAAGLAAALRASTAPSRAAAVAVAAK